MTGCGCSTRPRFPARQSRETVKRSDLAGYAAYGYCASHSRYFWGFRLYLVCSPDGMPHGFCLAPANEPEREVAAALLDRMRADGSLHGFEVIIGDKGFAGAEFEQIVSELAAAFLRPDRNDETRPPRQPRPRPAMDRIDHRHHQRPALPRTPRRPHPEGVWARICQRVLALAAGVWNNWQIGQPGRSFTAYDH